MKVDASAQTILQVNSSKPNEQEEDVSILTTDVLHHIMCFFVCESGVVDGQSLKASAVVCKRWREVVYSRQIWAIPATLEDVATSTTATTSTATSTATTNIVRSSISSSLAIRELSRDGQQRPHEASLIGFLKLQGPSIAARGSGDVLFRVLERATGKRRVISISKDEQKTSEMLKELLKAHCEQGETFLQPCLIENNQKRTLASHRFPLGVEVWKNGRTIRWYRDSVILPQPDLLTPLGGDDRSRDLDRSPLQECRRDAHLELKNFFKLETIGRFDPSRKHVRRDCWATLVDWMIEIVECFDLDDRTAFRAMSFFDRFVATVPQRVNKSLFQLVAGACLFIASKCEDRSITENDLSFCADNLFDARQIIRCEEIILQQLEWKLGYPVITDYILVYAKIIGLSDNDRIVWMMRYLAELALQSSIYLAYKPSMVASSVVILANFCLQEADIWPERLEHQSGYSWDSLEDCTITLNRSIEDIRSTMPDLTMVRRRYRKQKRGHVADILIPSIPSFDALTASRRLRQESHVTRLFS